MKVERIFAAYIRALRDFFHPAVLLFSFACFLFAVLLSSLFLWAFGSTFLIWLSSLTNLSFQGFWGFLLLVIVSFPLILFTGLLLFSLFASPWVRRWARRRGLSARDSSGGLSFSRQVFEAIAISAVGIFLWTVSLLLFWLPFVSFILWFTGVAWVQWRLLALDVWGETESPAGYRSLLERHRLEGFALSAGLTWLAFIPLVNFYLPILSALAFLHWDRELQHDKR
jgi:hypothetical protein